MALEQFKNAPLPSSPSTAWTLLSGAIDASVTTLTLLSAAPFPSVAQFRILIGDEMLLVTNLVGAVATVTRGVEGSTAAGHADGAGVYHIVTAASLLNNPRAMTTAGDTEYLSAAGAPTRLGAPANGQYAVTWATGVPSWSAIDLSGYTTTGALASEVVTRAAADTALSSLISAEAASRATADALLVPKTTTVNGHALSGNISVTASDVGLGSVENAAASSLYVPLARTVNGHALSANISVTASDVGLGSVENAAASALYLNKNTTQAANLVYAGPASGAVAAPTFRALVAADIPSLSYLGGSIADTQIAFGVGTDIGGSADLTWTPSGLVAVGLVDEGIGLVAVASGIGIASVSLITAGGDAALALDAAGVLALNYPLVLTGLAYPIADGNAGDVVTTDGAGVLTLQPLSGGNPFDQDLNTTDAPAFIGVTADTLNITGSGAEIFLGNTVILFGDIQTNAASVGSTISFRAFDEDGAAYLIFATLTNADVPSFALSAPVGGLLTGDFSALAVGGVAVATSDSASAFTNKTGAISQWTNDASYTTLAEVSGVGYLTSVTAHNLLSATHGDTTTGTVVRGDLITGQGASPKWTRLAKGTANQVLAMDGTATDIVWATQSAGAVATDAIWDAAGDLAVGTGANTAARLAIGTALQVLRVNAGATTLEWATPAGGGDALTSNPLSQFAATTSLQLKGVISDETGSGALVFATSPTLVTPAIGVFTGGSGTLTPANGVAAITVPTVTQTASAPVIDFTQTWNNGAIAFDGFLMNITETAAGSAYLMRLRLGGANKFSVDKSGTIQGAGSINSTSTSTNASLGIGNSDLFLYRDGANIWGQRNGSNAQKFRIYNTFTTINTAGEWLKFDWITTANQIRIGAAKGTSTGTARVLSLDYGGLEASPTAAITVPITSGSIVFGGGITLPDAGDIVVNATTGTKIGTATSQKIGFYNATPIVQGASVADATGGAIIDAEARAAINALIARVEAIGLIATV